ncbi:MAG: MFS transporter [Chloroflexota bacterium]|nr:MFS transporter [Chloroflexota bacterium]MDE2683496.1 MFS transporter [Chloroflexota bacterium]
MATDPAPQRSYLAQKAHRFLAALVFRDFRFLALASLSSGSGAWALIVARGAWVFSIPELHATWGLWVGLITFAAMSPRFFATPFIGYLADKMTRKTLLQRVYALQLAQASVMAILVMMGVDNPWYVVALAVINGTLRATQQTAAQSLTPNLVDRERLPNAVALNEAMQQGSRAVGPAILLAVSVLVGAGAIFQSGGVSFSIQNLLLTIGTSAVIFWSCAVFYLVALVAALSIRTVSSGVIDRNRSFWSNTAAGFVYSYTTPLIFGIILMALAHCVLVMSFESMLPPLALEKLSADGITFDQNDVYALMTALGIGALLSSIFVGGIVSHLTRGRVFLLLGFTSSLTPIGLGLSSQTGISMIAAVLMGLGTSGFMTITHTVIHSVVPDEIRGRVASVYSMHVGGSMAFANLLYGALADFWQAGLIMAISGAAFTLVVIGTLVGSGFWRGIYFRGEARPVAAASPAGAD